MARANFTADSVARLPYRRTPYGWCLHWHGRTPGFGVRVTEGLARSYVVSYRLRGSRAKRLRTIGSLEKFAFGAALKRAREVLHAAASGRDWFDDIKRERAQTMGDVWRYYEREHLASDAVAPRSYTNAQVLWRLHCEREFDKCALADISTERARDWHRRVSKGGAHNANRALQALRAAWNYGHKYGRIPRELLNPFAAIPMNKEVERKTILEPHQMPAFAKAVNGLEDPFARAYVWLLFYTGCRRTELLKLTWADVEILPERKGESRTGTILLHHTKGGEPRRVALSPPAIEILEKLPRTNNAYVFCGTVDGTHLDPKAHWHEARTAAGLPQLRLHDLRRSYGSWLGASGVTPKLIGTVLGHKTDITSRVYVQLGEAPGIKRQLAEAHAALAAQFAEEKPKAEVIKLANVQR